VPEEYLKIEEGAKSCVQQQEVEQAELRRQQASATKQSSAGSRWRIGCDVRCHCPSPARACTSSAGRAAPVAAGAAWGGAVVGAGSIHCM